MPFATVRSAYSGSKHFLNALTANLRMELRADYPDIQVSSVFPGVVATDFGLRAVGGGPDSRSFPGAQSPEAVANVIAACLEHPEPEVYTRPEFRAQVAAYYAAEDITAVEAQFRGPTLVGSTT